MRYVYLLQSVEFPDQTYVGLTDDLRSRFSEHNCGRSPHTAKYRPWRLVSYVAFFNVRKAVEFERYLKIGFRPGVCEQAAAVASDG
jgi:putative endonuclease